MSVRPADVTFGVILQSKMYKSSFNKKKPFNTWKLSKNESCKELFKNNKILSVPALCMYSKPNYIHLITQ